MVESDLVFIFRTVDWIKGSELGKINFNERSKEQGLNNKCLSSHKWYISTTVIPQYGCILMQIWIHEELNLLENQKPNILWY